MANLSQYAQIMLLNYLNSGSTGTRPVAWGIALGTGIPASTGNLLGEIGTAMGYARQSATWGLASGTPPVGTNLNAATFGPFTSSGVVSTWGISGIVIYDSVNATPGIGNELWFGTLAAARAVTAGDSLVIAAGNLTTQIN